VRLAFRALNAHQQHVFGEPAFLARLPAGDAQRVTLLAQQRVAAVARAHALDGQLLGEMHDEATFRIQVADGVQALDEFVLALDPAQRLVAHARHQAHVHDYIRAIGDFYAAAGERRIDRAHAVGDHIHGPAAHRAGEQCIDLAVGLLRIHPMIVGAGVFLRLSAHEGQVLDSRHVGGVGAVQITIRVGLLVELDKIAARKHRFDQRSVLGIRPVAPVNRLGLGQAGDFVHPACERRIRRGHYSSNLRQ
jgi:hypothetical protein